MKRKNLLRYVGSKKAIAPWVVENLPQAELLVDCCFGGGSISFEALKSGKFQEVVAYERNPHVFNFWKWVAHEDSKGRMFSELQNAIVEYNSRNLIKNTGYYQWLVQEHNRLQDPQEHSMWLYDNGANNTLYAAVVFFLLNQTCFNGLYRTNLGGKYNVPFGKKKQIPELSAELFDEHHDYLKKIWLANDSFFESIYLLKNDGNSDLTQGVLLYIDPPYLPRQNTQPVNYGLPAFDHYQMFKTVLEAKMEHQTVISHSDVSKFVSLAEEFGFVVKATTGHKHIVSCDSSKRTSLEEVLFSSPLRSDASS